MSGSPIREPWKREIEQVSLLWSISGVPTRYYPLKISSSMCSGQGGRQALVGGNKVLRARMLEAQERGIMFDVGFGGGSCFYEYALPAFDQGLRPNTTSTDLHTGSVNGGLKTLLNAVSTLMSMGMTVQEAIEAATWAPAQLIRREDLGHLREGAEADIAVFRLLQGDFGFQDSRRNRIDGTEKLETELTLRRGRVVYDLNGK